MDALIQSDEPAKSVSGAEEQISIHNQHKAEIDTRFADIVRLIKSGQRMAQQGHYATAEVLYTVYMHHRSDHLYIRK